MTARVLLGHVVKAHGIRGALRMRPLSGSSVETARTLEAASAVFLDDEPRELVRIRLERDELLLELRDLSDRTAAEALQGRSVFVERSALPELDDDEVYLTDLVGCEVVDRAGARLGLVTGSFNAGAQDTLILDAKGRELLLPWVEAYLVEVNVAAKKIVYDPPPGLIDLDEAEPG